MKTRALFWESDDPRLANRENSGSQGMPSCDASFELKGDETLIPSDDGSLLEGKTEHFFLCSVVL